MDLECARVACCRHSSSFWAGLLDCQTTRQRQVFVILNGLGSWIPACAICSYFRSLARTAVCTTSSAGLPTAYQT